MTCILVFGVAMHSVDALMETLNVRTIFTTGFWYQAGEANESSSGINWATILFIAGMMIMVEGMAKTSRIMERRGAHSVIDDIREGIQIFLPSPEKVPQAW